MTLYRLFGYNVVEIDIFHKTMDKILLIQNRHTATTRLKEE